jgi:putative endonuclease
LSRTRQDLGRWGESLAGDFLRKKGYTIISCNERTPYGEIDLVAVCSSEEEPDSADVLVFVEVKTRSSRKFGYPEESITARKKTNLIAASQCYLQEHPELDMGWRIDVISIEQYSSSAPIIHHFENAVR